MKVLRRLFGALVLLFAVVGIVACAAAVVGVWILHQDLVQKVQTIYGRVDNGLNRLTDADQKVLGALVKAREDLERYRAEASRQEADKPDRDSLRRMIFLQTAGPRINELGGRLDTFADAAVVVASLLQSMQDLPLAADNSINADDLNRASDQAAELARAIRKLQNATRGDNPAAAQDMNEASREVDLVLRNSETTVQGWYTDLKNAQLKLAEYKARLLAWLLLGAVAVTVIAVWAGIGQVSLFAHGWKWCFGA